MKTKNKRSKTLSYILLGLAIIGFIMLWLSSGGKMHYYRGSASSESGLSRLWPFAIGITLVLPYLIYSFRSGPKQKKILGSNHINLNKIGHTTESYSQYKAKKGIVEIYVQNETGHTLIINRESLLEDGNWHVFKVRKRSSLHLSNGVTFKVTKEGEVVIIENSVSVSGVEDAFKLNNGVPDYADHAFVLTKNVSKR